MSGADDYVTATLLCFLTTTILNTTIIHLRPSDPPLPNRTTIMTTTQSLLLEAPTSRYFLSSLNLELQYPDSEEIDRMELQYPDSEELHGAAVSRQ